MQNEMPFYEQPEDALKAAIFAIGGTKAVGQMLWKDKSVDQAARYLMDCINQDRPEKLAYTQIIFIFREAKAAGFHAGFEWWAAQCEYDTRPITKAEEVDRLTAVVEQASKSLSGALAALERIQKTNIRSVA